MNSAVNFQHVGTRKSFRTDRTCVRTISSVCPHVFSQLIRDIKSFVTNAANVGFYASVGSHMSCKISLRRVILPTNVTLHCFTLKKFKLLYLHLQQLLVTSYHYVFSCDRLAGYCGNISYHKYYTDVACCLYESSYVWCMQTSE
jgi:hypothetical protein